MVEPIAAEAGQVDPADEGDLVVDDHELLVVAVGEALVTVEHALDPRPGAELLAALPDGRAGRLEHRDGRPGPDEDPDGHPFGQLAEEAPDRRSARPPPEPEVGLDVPAGDVDVRTGGGDRRGDPREGVGAVDHHLEGVPRPRARVAGAPQPVGRRVEPGGRAEPAEPAPVVGARQSLDRVADSLVEALPPAGAHAAIPPHHTRGPVRQAALSGRPA